MILTCPACSASYNVDANQIGPDGRDVRCKKCRHVWFQQGEKQDTPKKQETHGEKQALDELINRIQSSEIDIDDIGFDDPKVKSKQAPKIKAKEEKSGPNILSRIVSGLAARFKSPANAGVKTPFLNHVAGGMVALAVVSCLLFGLVSQRWAIVKILPSLEPVYLSAGFPLHDYANVNPEEALIIDRLGIAHEAGVTSVSGNIINITSQNIRVPALKLSFLDEKGAVLKETTYHLPLAILKKELTFPFNIALEKTDPSSFASVYIKFVE